MNGKCLFCWGSYSLQHPAMRMLPCGHILGRDCITEMSLGPTGANCPACQTAMFRPSPMQRNLLSIQASQAVDSRSRSFDHGYLLPD